MLKGDEADRKNLGFGKSPPVSVRDQQITNMAASLPRFPKPVWHLLTNCLITGEVQILKLFKH